MNIFFLNFINDYFFKHLLHFKLKKNLDNLKIDTLISLVYIYKNE